MNDKTVDLTGEGPAYDSNAKRSQDATPNAEAKV